MLSQRHLRLRVLGALERTVKQFRSREELWPLRVPHEPLSLDRVIDEALGDDRRSLDPASLRSRTLLHLEWRAGAAWDAWVVVLPSGVKLYCDTGDDESRILASGGRNEGDASDRLFLQLLSESGGEHFGIEMADAPVHARSSIDDRAFLVDVFVNLFEVAGVEEAIRSDLAAGESKPADTDALGHDFRVDVERWLDCALRAPRAL
jgi:hypothetical protein